MHALDTFYFAYFIYQRIEVLSIFNIDMYVPLKYPIVALNCQLTDIDIQLIGNNLRQIE